jgi:hypothetical protein
MGTRKSITEIQLQLKKLEEDQKENEKFFETYKKQISKELKSFNPEEIKNTPVIEKKYSLWQRIKKTLGMN